MARITQISDVAAAPEAAVLFTAIKGKIGMVPNLYRVAANQPKVLAALLGMNETLSKRGFDARTREAIALTVAGIVETVANVVANIFTNYLNHVADTNIDFPARKARAA